MGYSSYSPEFRSEAVRLVRELSRPVADVAKELNVGTETLRVWVNRKKIASRSKQETELVEDEKEVRRLQRRIVELEQENAFLKKAAAFFAAEPNHKNGLR
jgi:transposase